MICRKVCGLLLKSERKEINGQGSRKSKAIIFARFWRRRRETRAKRRGYSASVARIFTRGWRGRSQKSEIRSQRSAIRTQRSRKQTEGNRCQTLRIRRADF